MFAFLLREKKTVQRDVSGRTLPFLGTLILFLFAATGLHAKTSADDNAGFRLPERFGEVVYQEHVDRDHKIFIIAQSHRSAITGKQNEDCQKVQAEIYRIGEWLIANEKVEALLPEGYFSTTLPDADTTPLRQTGTTTESNRLDDATLAARLSNPTMFVNADRLLHTTYDLALRQIEDRQLYLAVVRQLRSLLSNSRLQKPDPAALSILSYQQKKRSAVLLENIPAALTGENSLGNAGIRRAMLTVGLSHVDTMIDLLKSKDGTAQILPPSGEKGSFGEICFDLSRLKEGYAIAVIIPRALVDSGIRLRLSKLGNTSETETAENSANLEPTR